MAEYNFVIKNGVVVNTAFTANSTLLQANGLTVNSTVATFSGNVGGTLTTTSQPYITANNTSFVGTTSAANVVSNAQLQANLVNYAQLAGGTFTGPTNFNANVTITGNLIVTGTTISANVTNLDVKDLNITVAKGVATAAAADGAGLTVDTANVTWNYNNATNSWQSNVNITPASNNTLNLGTTGLTFANVYANNVMGTNLYGTLQTTSQPNITANNANFVKANNGITSNSSGVFVTQGTGVVVNATGVHVNASYVGTLTANNSTYLNGQLASYYTNATNIITGTLDTARLPATVNAATAVNVGANVNINTSAIAVGNSTVNTFITQTEIDLPFALISSGNLVTSATTANQTLDQFPFATYKAAEYFIYVASGAAFQVSKLSVLTDGTTAYSTEYSTMLTSTALASFDVSISGANVLIRTTPVNAITTYKLHKKLINI